MLYVSEEGQEFFTVFDLADLGLGPIPNFEEISGGSVNAAAGTNPPITGIGGLSGALLFAFFGTPPLEDGAEDISGADPANWQSFVRIVSLVSQQFERIAGELLKALTTTLVADLGCPLWQTNSVRRLQRLTALVR